MSEPGHWGNDGKNSLRWIVAQEGSRRTYTLPLAFERMGVLRLMYADIWCLHARDWLRKGSGGLRALSTRHHKGIADGKVVSFSAGAILKKAWLHHWGSRLQRQDLGNFYCEFGRWYATRIKKHLERLELDPLRDCFIGFNTNCLELLGFLKERQVRCILDQVDPARIEESIIQEEASRWPGWSNGDATFSEGYWNRIKAEWDLADYVRVSSEWSREALVRQRVSAHKIFVAPLAIELPESLPRPIDINTGVLKVLYLGSLILRKGVAYLAEAARLLERHNIEFLMAGPVGISERALKTFPANMRLLGRITRDQLKNVYRQAHLFVFPTLSDAFGVTQLEAMSQGLPVIATPHCARVVTHGHDGLIVPARDGAALAEAIARLDGDRHFLHELSANALKTVQKYGVPNNGLAIQREVLKMREKKMKSGHSLRHA